MKNVNDILRRVSSEKKIDVAQSFSNIFTVFTGIVKVVSEWRDISRDSYSSSESHVEYVFSEGRVVSSRLLYSEEYDRSYGDPGYGISGSVRENVVGNKEGHTPAHIEIYYGSQEYIRVNADVFSGEEKEVLQYFHRTSGEVPMRFVKNIQRAISRWNKSK